MTGLVDALPDFETFLLDPANRAAANAARAVADASGVPYAPLLVLGAPGTGKTELLRAIAARVRSRHPTAIVELWDVDHLAAEHRAAAASGRGEARRAALLLADLVLVDDYERLTRHRDAQGLVADLLDARRAAGRETVVAGSLPPGELEGLDARLVRRLEEGSRVTLSLPGFEARRAILRRRAVADAVRLADEVVDAVAEAPFETMREYTGAISRLLAFQQVSPVPLSPADALALIGVGAGFAEPEPAATEPFPARPPAAAPPPAAGADEFGAFLSEITSSVSEQVDRWRERIGEAVVRWNGQGYRTRRLEALVEEEIPTDPEPVLAAFGADVAELRRLAAEVAALAPDLAGAEVFQDPDQLPAARGLLEQARGRGVPLTAPLPQYRLEEFAAGAALRPALEALQEVLAEPGRRHAPLVLVGASGVGKTHLLHGLGNALAAAGVAPLGCLAAPAFAGELAAALASGERLAAWRSRYRWVGALLLDDLHLLAGERRAQEELLQLVAELNEGQRQMVFTVAHPLGELEGLDPRLVARLEGGLVLRLPAPDREVRRQLVKRLLAATPAAHDAALADYLAARPVESVRALNAAVQRVLAESETQRVTPSPAFAREILDVPEGAAQPARRSGPSRASGILAPGLGLVQSREKMVLEWPRVADRLIAEMK